MNALVFGGTQFVGRVLAMELIARGHDVSLATRGRLPLDYDGVRWHHLVDRRDAKGLSRLEGERFDAVFDVSGYRADDVAPVLATLCLEAGMHYVFVSSGAVYAPSDAPLAEDAPKGANANWGAYGTDKLAVEELLREHCARTGCTLSIVRPAYVYGPGNNLYREAYLFDRLGCGKTVPVPRGDAKTQFVHVSDLTNMLVGLAERTPDGTVEAFNYAHPEPVGWVALVKAAAEAMGAEPRVREVDCQDALGAREFFPFRDCTYLLDVGKAARIGFRPAIDLRDGLETAYAWYRRARPRLSDSKMTRIEEALAQG